jgi:hypothetical protein
MPGVLFKANMIEFDQQLLPQRLVGTYDRFMSHHYNGQEFRAGRLKSAEPEAWGFLNVQEDLSVEYFDGIEQLARSTLEGKELEGQKHKLTLKFWAALARRLSGDAPMAGRHFENNAVHRQATLLEMEQAYNWAAENHKRLIGCGGGIGISDDLSELSIENAFSSIFGNKKEPWAWKKGTCRIKKCASPKPTEVGPCSVCRNCQAKFDNPLVADPKAD